MICISLGNISFEECSRHVLTEEFVELRIDLLKPTPVRLKELLSLPGKKIVTCRQGEYSDNERIEIFTEAINRDVEYIDLELGMPAEMKKKVIAMAKPKKCRVIVSHHDYSGTPMKGELLNLIESCKASGADIVKLACQVNEPADNIRLLSLLEEKEQLVIIGMGELGTITRIAGPLLGSKFTYAAPGQKQETAEGQLTKETLLQVYNLIGTDIKGD